MAQLFTSAVLRGAGVVYQLKHDFWELRSNLLQPDLAWYICDTCGTITRHNLRGVCRAYRCTGRLRKCNPPEVFGSNHYYRLYTGMEPMRMRVEEHTAQLTSHAAAQLQQKFTKGEVNILSCSTTFELGVDVGDLQAVFMRNMPLQQLTIFSGLGGRQAPGFCRIRPHICAEAIA